MALPSPPGLAPGGGWGGVSYPELLRAQSSRWVQPTVGSPATRSCPFHLTVKCFWSRARAGAAAILRRWIVALPLSCFLSSRTWRPVWPAIPLPINGDVYKKEGQWTLISPIILWCPTGGWGVHSKRLRESESLISPFQSTVLLSGHCIHHAPFYPRALAHAAPPGLCSSGQSYLPFRSQFKCYFDRNLPWPLTSSQFFIFEALRAFCSSYN